MRIHCDYMFLTAKCSCHCRGTLKTSGAKGLKRHLFPRILEQNKQTNKLFFNVQKNTDNCYSIPVDNKNLIFIPEQRKNRFNHFLKITNGLVFKERICGVTSFTKYDLLLWYFVLLLSFALLSFLF